jgi:glutamate N-acetyltransferase / amino-acid N-acetyltransferase
MAGMDKGAGMIHPKLNMGSAATSFTSPKQLHATLLGGIMTDAAVTHLCRRQKLQFYQC